MFRAIARATETIFNIIVFSFLKKAISNIIISKRLKILISQNLDLINSLYKIKVLRGL